MEKLKFVKEPFYASLRDGIQTNIEKYKEHHRSWLTQHGMAGIGIGTTGISVNRLRPLTLPTGKQGEALKDLENTKIVYSDLKELTPQQAQDHRLWVYMTHVVYWDYMQKRWPVTADSVVKRRYFFEGATKDALVRNGIARLWWFGYLTYDENRDDPFELTPVLLQNQDIQTALLERSFGRNRVLLMSILDFIKSNQSRFNSGEGMSKNVQKLGVNINLHGGLAMLDCMEAEQIASVLENSATF